MSSYINFGNEQVKKRSWFNFQGPLLKQRPGPRAYHRPSASTTTKYTMFNTIFDYAWTSLEPSAKGLSLPSFNLLISEDLSTSGIPDIICTIMYTLSLLFEHITELQNVTPSNTKVPDICFGPTPVQWFSYSSIKKYTAKNSKLQSSWSSWYWQFFNC